MATLLFVRKYTHFQRGVSLKLGKVQYSYEFRLGGSGRTQINKNRQDRFLFLIPSDFDFCSISGCSKCVQVVFVISIFFWLIIMFVVCGLFLTFGLSHRVSRYKLSGAELPHLSIEAPASPLISYCFSFFLAARVACVIFLYISYLKILPIATIAHGASAWFTTAQVFFPHVSQSFTTSQNQCRE